MTQERARLLELVGLVEAATGPDRLLDNAIANTVRLPLLKGDPAYTASLDAAMTLVPEGWGVRMGLLATAWAQCIRVRPLEDCQIGDGATLPLALCAAALRARAALANQDDSK